MSGKTHFGTFSHWDYVWDGVDSMTEVEMEVPLCGCRPDDPVLSDEPSCKNCLRMLQPPKPLDAPTDT